MLNTNLFLKLTRRETVSDMFSDYKTLYIRPRIICKDGFQISIQASDTHYCKPQNIYAEVYEKVELGYPNEKEDLIMDYAEDEGDIETVYAYVPVTIVDEMLEKHGGIVDIFGIMK